MLPKGFCLSVLWPCLWLVGPRASREAAVGRVVAGGVAGAVAARGGALQLLAVVLTAAAERVPGRD